MKKTSIEELRRLSVITDDQILALRVYVPKVKPRLPRVVIVPAHEDLDLLGTRYRCRTCHPKAIKAWRRNLRWCWNRLSLTMKRVVHLWCREIVFMDAIDKMEKVEHMKGKTVEVVSDWLGRIPGNRHSMMFNLHRGLQDHVIRWVVFHECQHVWQFYGNKMWSISKQQRELAADDFARKMLRCGSDENHVEDLEPDDDYDWEGNNIEPDLTSPELMRDR